MLAEMENNAGVKIGTKRVIYQTSKLTSQWKRSGTGVKTGSSYLKLSRITMTVFGSNPLDSTPNTKGEREGVEEEAPPP